MVEGGASDDFREVKTLLYRRPELLHHILAINAMAVVEYLNAQIAAAISGWLTKTVASPSPGR